MVEGLECTRSHNNKTTMYVPTFNSVTNRNRSVVNSSVERGIISLSNKE